MRAALSISLRSLLSDAARAVLKTTKGVSAPKSADDSAFYRSEPHNSYAAWLHDVCPGIYAFPYDDVQTSADPFHACSNSTQLNITFCPAG